MGGAELAHLCEIAGRRDDDAGFPLDRLDKENDRVRRDGVRQCRGIAKGDNLEAPRKWAEMLACGDVGAEADDTEGASVEIVGADDDLGITIGYTLHFVAPFANGLDRA